MEKTTIDYTTLKMFTNCLNKSSLEITRNRKLINLQMRNNKDPMQSMPVYLKGFSSHQDIHDQYIYPCLRITNHYNQRLIERMRHATKSTINVICAFLLRSPNKAGFPYPIILCTQLFLLLGIVTLNCQNKQFRVLY